jgi:hypothetical protein
MVGMKALALATVVLLASCGSRPTAQLPIDPALAMLVPPDTTALAGVRLDSLRKLPYYEKLLTVGPSGGLNRFLQDIGFDPQSELAELLVASNAKDTFAALRGKFPPEVIASSGVLKREKLVVQFMDASTAVAGHETVVRTIAAKRNQFAGPPGALLAPFDSVPETSQIWAVALGGFLPGLQNSTGNWGNVGRLLERTRRFIFTASFNGGLTLDAKGECATFQDAGSLQAMARGMLALGRYTSRKKPALQNLYEAFSVSRQDRTVAVHAVIPKEVLERVIGDTE